MAGNRATPEVRRNVKEHVHTMLLNESKAQEPDSLEVLAARIVHNVLAVLIQEGVIEKEQG